MIDLENEVRRILKKNNWLSLATTDNKNIPHSSVVDYQSDGYVIYCLTGKNTLKAKNIRTNNKVSVTLPFRKNFFHKIIPAPPAESHFIAEAEVKSFDDEEVRKIFSKYLKYQENLLFEVICKYDIYIETEFLHSPEMDELYTEHYRDKFTFDKDFKFLKIKEIPNQ